MTANTPASRKGKARRYQQEIRDMILESFDELTEGDVESVPMGVPGEDLWMSPLASKIFPFAVEAKNQEKLSIWDALKQAESHVKSTEKYPVLFFKRNREPSRTVLRSELFIKMVKLLHENGLIDKLK